MDADSLRALQAPLKQRYRDAPDSALITLSAEGSIDDVSIACKVETGRALVTAGLHPATGGSGMKPYGQAHAASSIEFCCTSGVSSRSTAITRAE